MLVETKARVGVFAIALGAYLPQFPTLVPEFEQQYADFKKTIPNTGKSWTAASSPPRNFLWQRATSSAPQMWIWSFCSC